MFSDTDFREFLAGVVAFARSVALRHAPFDLLHVEGIEFWRQGRELGLPEATDSWGNQEIQHMLWLRAGAKPGGGGGSLARERETKGEMELERELRMCRARLAAQDEMMMGVVKVKQESNDAKSAAQAQLKDAQQALVHAIASRRSELQALHAQMTQVCFLKSLSYIVRDLIQ